MGYTDAARNAMLDALSSQARWVSLHSGVPGETGASELGAVPYARQQINWNPAVLGRLGSDSKPLFRVPQGVQATHVGLWAAVTGGVFCASADVADVTYRTEAGYVLTNLSLDLTGFVLTAPDVPLNTVAVAISSSTIDVMWSPVSTAQFYSLERSDTGDASLDDFIFVGTSEDVTFSDTNLVAAHTYYYRVQALNAAGGSRFSLIAQATTQPQVETLPDTPTGLVASNITSTSARLTWSSSNRAESYRLERSFQSTSGFATVATVGEPLNDNEPPSVPTNLRFLNITTTTLGLAWDASTDNVGIALYQIDRDGTNIGVVGPGAETGTHISGLQPDMTYTFKVQARDTSDNRSAFSAPASVTTAAAPSGDTTPPTTPTNLTASSITQTTATLTWTGSVDSVGVTGYEIEQNAVVVRLVEATGNQGTQMVELTASTAYTFRVRGLDAADNKSGFSSAASITTSAPVTGNLIVALTGDMCENGFQDPGGTGKQAHIAVSDLVISESRIHAAILCGDLQYSSGTIAEFAAGYTKSYARHDQKNILTPGNHEANSNFSGYDDWVANHDTYVARGTAHQPNQPTKRWYGVHLPNGWSVVNLDSNVPSSSEQLTWLNNWLQNETVGKHVIAQWHHPRWNAKGTTGLTGFSELYNTLYNNRVDFLLVGHAHYYLRVERLNPSGQLDNTRGVQELLVGTGGHSLDLNSNSNPHGQKFVWQHGIARLELTPTSANGVFIGTKGQTLDTWTIPLLNRAL